MERQTQERWKQLCEQASTEQDSQKLAELVKEITFLLGEKKQPTTNDMTGNPTQQTKG